MKKEDLAPSLRALLKRVMDVHPDDCPPSLRDIREIWWAKGCPILPDQEREPVRLTRRQVLVVKRLKGRWGADPMDPLEVDDARRPGAYPQPADMQIDFAAVMGQLHNKGILRRTSPGWYVRGDQWERAERAVRLVPRRR